MLSVDEALELINQHITVLTNEPVDLSDSIGRILATDCHSTLDSPPYDKSMVDGFAIRSADLTESGGEFQYIRDFRDTDKEDMNYDGVDKLLKNQISYDTLNMNSGTLVLFRGKNSIHRVTPVEGEKTRILAVLAYNSEPNISLSETSRMTFYGRLD